MLKKVAAIAFCCSGFATGDALTQYFYLRRRGRCYAISLFVVFSVYGGYGLTVLCFLAERSSFLFPF